MEAPPRFELGHRGVADLCLTTWLWCLIVKNRKHRLRCFLFLVERITRLELATFTLARWRSTGWAKSADLVLPDGIEPSTRGFSVPCSTDWATEAQMATRNGLEPSTSSVTGWRSNQLNYRAIWPKQINCFGFGGNNRARTCDPLLVRQVLSQLSYNPGFFMVRPKGLEPLTFWFVVRHSIQLRYGCILTFNH